MSMRVRSAQITAHVKNRPASPTGRPTSPRGKSNKDLRKKKGAFSLRSLVEGGAKGGGLLGRGGLPSKINLLIVQGKPRRGPGLFSCFGGSKVFADEDLELVEDPNRPATSEFKLAKRLRLNGYDVATYSMWAVDETIVKHACVCVGKECFSSTRALKAQLTSLRNEKVAITPVLVPGWEGNAWRTFFSDGEIKEVIDLRGITSDFQTEVLKLQERYRFPQTEKEKIETIQSVFEKADANNDGKIDQQELTNAFIEMEMGVTEEDVLSVIHEADANGDGRIDFKEFMDKMAPILNR